MSSRNQFMIIGGVIGAVLGALAAWAYVESQQRGGLWTKKRQHGHEVAVKAGVTDYFKVGMTVYGLVRQLQGLVQPL